MSDFRLKVFQSVAKNLSFTKASQELFVSQPAITKHIQELEAAYQTLNPQLHSRSATYKRNGLLIRKTAIKSSRPFQCAYYPLTP